MRKLTLVDYLHVAIAVVLAIILCMWPLGGQAWDTQGYVFATFLCLYLYKYWRAEMVAAPVQAGGVHETPAAAPAPNRAAPVQAERHAMPMATPLGVSPTPTGAKPSPYVGEAKKINTLLTGIYKLNCQVNERDIMMTPSFVGYVVQPTGPLKFTDLQKIEDDLAREIKQFSRSNTGDDVSVIAVNTQPIVLQVTRKTPQVLAWSEHPDSDKPFQATVAKYWNGVVENYLTIRVDDDDYVNGALFGQPGAGKSTMLHIALIALLKSTSPEQLEVYCVDMKKDMFSEYANIPHVKQTVSTVEDALKIMTKFSEWCKANQWPRDGKIRLLIIDELQMLMTHTQYGPVAIELLTNILQRGREAGLRVWTATQNPNAVSYPTDLKPLTHWMGCAYIMNDDYVRRQLKIMGVSKLRTKGELIFVGPQGDYRVKTFWLTPLDRQNEIAGLFRRWSRYRHAPAVQPEAEPVRELMQEQPAPVRQEYTSDFTPAAPPQYLGPDEPWRLPERPLSPDEEEAVCKLLSDERFHTAGKPSQNKIIEHVYEGAKNSGKIKHIKFAVKKGGFYSE